MNQCAKCGCTQWAPCETRFGPCHWVLVPSANMAGVCSECATSEDYAMAAMIRDAASGSWERPMRPRFSKSYRRDH